VNACGYKRFQISPTTLDVIFDVCINSLILPKRIYLYIRHNYWTMASIISKLLDMENMKILFFLLQIAFASAAHSQELPKSTPINELPSSTALVVKRDIVLLEKSNKPSYSRVEFNHEYKEKYNDYNGFYVLCRERRVFKASSDRSSLLRVTSIKSSSIHRDAVGNKYPEHDIDLIDFYFVSDEVDESLDCSVRIITIEEPIPKTIEDLMPYLDGMFEFVDTDPYAKFDDETALKIIVKKITTLIENGSYTDSLFYFSMWERRQENLPEEFYYYYAKALEQTGNKEKSMKYATKYLNKYGKDGGHYEQIIELIALL